jgi:hypothetical protein
MMINKKAQVGKFSVNFYVTILIIIILVVFVLWSGVVRKFSDTDLDTRIYDSESIGIYDSVLYLQEEYVGVVMKRVGLEPGGGTDG